MWQFILQHLWELAFTGISGALTAAYRRLTKRIKAQDDERKAIAQMPYEEARDKLIEAVQALEAGGLNLDQSMRQWEVGEALAQRAQTLLNEVRAKLDAAQNAQAATADTAGTQSNLD